MHIYVYVLSVYEILVYDRGFLVKIEG
jgi:hypothetical protein